MIVAPPTSATGDTYEPQLAAFRATMLTLRACSDTIRRRSPNMARHVGSCHRSCFRMTIAEAGHADTKSDRYRSRRRGGKLDDAYTCANDFISECEAEVHADFAAYSHFNSGAN